MVKLVNYQTKDIVANNAHIAIQITNCAIILFPIIALFFLNTIDKYKLAITMLIVATIVTCLISFAYHCCTHSSDTISRILLYADAAGVTILSFISFLIVFNIIMDQDTNNMGSVKNVYRAFYLVTMIGMILSWLYARKWSKLSKNSESSDSSTKIYNIFHSLWHMGGAMILIITILYGFTKFSKTAE